MESPKDFATIIIACRNEEKFIVRCLDSVIGGDYPGDLMEILVVDGMSEDNTRTIVADYSKKNPQVKLLDNPGKFTPSGFNIGIRNARGKFILLMGAHSTYARDYVLKCVSRAREYQADNVGGMCNVLPQINTLVNKAIVFSITSLLGSGDALYKTSRSAASKFVDTVFGGCYRRSVFEKIGMFNENLARSQDMELNIRLKKAGGKIMMFPDIKVNYYPKPTLRQFFIHNFWDGVWAVYPLKFVKMPLRLRHYVPLFFVILFVILGISGIFFLPARAAFFLMAAGYLLAVFYFSVRIAAKEKDLLYLFAMPAAFAARHFAYGIGSLWGVVKLMN